MLSVVVFKWEPYENQLESIPTQVGKSKVTYSAEMVNKHYNMVKRHLHIPFRYILITDHITPQVNKEIEQKKLWTKHRELGGCFHRLFTFSKEFEEYVGERFVAMDLDMVITGDITQLLDVEPDFVYYRMKGSDGTGWRMNNQMYMMNTGARSHVWELFDADPKAVMAHRKGPGTDQGVTNALLNIDREYHWVQGVNIYDMRQDFIEPGRIELPDDCRIVMWPGPRDPNVAEFQENYPWIDTHYR